MRYHEPEIIVLNHRPPCFVPHRFLKNKGGQAAHATRRKSAMQKSQAFICSTAIAAAVFLVGHACLAAGVYDPAQYGAKPDGETLSTAAIQKAMDTCAAAGGGTVRLTKGQYVSGTLFFRSGVTLELGEGVTLLGSTDLKDYPAKLPAYPSLMNDYMEQSLLYAERVEKISLRGPGQIDFRGGKFKGRVSSGAMPGRPFGIRMIECKDVTIEGITLRNSAAWMESYLACDNLTLRGVTVFNHCQENNDGIDIDGCRKVRISDVTVNAEDDGLCFKGTSLRPTTDVVVENSRFWSYCNALKFGTDSQGGFRDVVVRNVELGGPPAGSPPPPKGYPPHGIGAIAWEIVDGGTMENVVVDHVKIRGTQAPIYLCVADRGRHLKDAPRLPPGVMRNITISNVDAQEASPLGCLIIGLDDHPVENVTLRNIAISSAGGGQQKYTVRRFKTKSDSYPEVNKYASHLPAFGLYGWHVKGLTLDNVRFTTVKPDERPAIALEDTAEVTIDGTKVDADHPPKGVTVMRAAK
jgi:polygalacturonase